MTAIFNIFLCTSENATKEEGAGKPPRLWLEASRPSHHGCFNDIESCFHLSATHCAVSASVLPLIVLLLAEKKRQRQISLY